MLLTSGTRQVDGDGGHVVMGDFMLVLVHGVLALWESRSYATRSQSRMSVDMETFVGRELGPAF